MLESFDICYSSTAIFVYHKSEWQNAILACRLQFIHIRTVLVGWDERVGTVWEELNVLSTSAEELKGFHLSLALDSQSHRLSLVQMLLLTFIIFSLIKGEWFITITVETLFFSFLLLTIWIIPFEIIN